jgi:hypothetical protein
MPRGPRGEKRPADVIGAAVMVAKIATGWTSKHNKRTIFNDRAADARRPGQS